MPKKSSSTSIVTSILAGGTCVTPPKNFRDHIENKNVDTLTITIDGNQLMSQDHSDSLFGKPQENQALEFLSHSQTFKLSYFEPKPNGQCELIYTRVHKKTP